MLSPFLTAEWRKLVVINYPVDPKVLTNYLPYKTEIDTWNGICFISLVGFMFLNTKLIGVKVPYHVDFEEVNLRFYVKYKDGAVYKRGVVFINEIVPKHSISLIANLIYKEKYMTMPMSHSWTSVDNLLTIEYRWKKTDWNFFNVKAIDTMNDIVENSEEEFITEHFWGYTKVNDRNTLQYNVEHPRWKVYDIIEYEINVNFKEVYGNDFAFLIDLEPKSVFLAEGSNIIVRKGSRI